MFSQAFEAFLSTKAVARVFAPPSVVQAMLDVEAALARAQAAEGLLPEAAARAIAGVCKAELFDVDAIVADSVRAGSLAIPLVRRLTETVALFDAEAAGHVHRGSTSQDVIDTALALLLRRALALIDRDLSALAGHLLGHARAHAEAPVLARTLLQPAQVVSVGFKALAWIAPLLRSQQALREAASRGLQLQLGGAVGTRSMLGPRAAAIAARMAAELRLADPATAWHTQRDELMRLHAEVGILCGTLGKIAQDWSLMAQAEVGELAEPSGGGRGGSSAVPHQRKPVASMVALSAALRTPHRVAALLAAMPQQHERGLGNWQAELAEAAGLYGSAHGAVAALAEAAAGLVVEPARMRRNIEAMQGLVHAEMGEDSAPHRLDATLGALFSAERAARPAVEIAGPQLEALGAQADRLAASAPWAAWLDPSAPDTETA
jgi:3-carboxy-cis,cis-muconate cycloisomerase